MPSPFTIEIDAEIVPQATAGTGQSTTIGEAPFAGVVSAASIILTAAVAFNATNYRIFTLFNRGQAGAGTIVVATLDTSAVAFVADDERAMTLSGTPANLVLVKGDVLELVETVAGTGVAHGGGKVMVGTQAEN